MKNISKSKIALLLVVSILLFTSCSPNKQTATEYTPQQIVEVVIDSQISISSLRMLLPGDDYFNGYLEENYKINPDIIEDGVIFYANGVYANEIAVFILADNDGAKKVRDALEAYIKQRIGAFMGYSPAQADILEKSVAVVSGNYAALLICEDAQSAKNTFNACFTDYPPKLPEVSSSPSPSPSASPAPSVSPSPEPSPSPSPSPSSSPEPSLDNYNPDTILAAWFSGDNSELSEKNKKIYDACVETISAIITDEMEAYDKELAIHDWIINQADYDYESMNPSNDAKPDPDNGNPYGVIYSGKSICLGYTLTFQLFMDMLEIECITVHGTNTAYEEHAWNMVNIDGKWYCVDVTWDDPMNTSPPSHTFFNVTSAYMRQSHIWNENDTPVADSGKLYK